MRRMLDRQQSTLFRGGELARLMTMIVMLGVIFMLMGKARDTRTWRMFVLDDESGQGDRYTLAQFDAAAEKEREATERETETRAERTAELTAQKQTTPAETISDSPDTAASTTPEQPTASEPAETEAVEKPPAEQPAAAEPEIDDPRRFKPTDEDIEESESLKEELEAVDDKTQLAEEEMPAYLRLLNWTMNQSTAEMRKRAKKNVRFNDVFSHPDRYRGKLLDIDVHIRRALIAGDLPKNALGLKRTIELWGWNDNSQPYSYVIVCPEVPPNMPLGGRLGEEGRFVGYFLKLMAYEDHEGKRRSAPLLIGRVVWDPSPLARQKAVGPKTDWTWWIVCGVLLTLFLLRWGTRLMAAPGASRESLVRSRGRAGENEEIVPIETWLERAEDEPGDARDREP